MKKKKCLLSFVAVLLIILFYIVPGTTASYFDEKENEIHTQSNAPLNTPTKERQEEKHIHSYISEIITPATCIDAGEIIFACKCGASYSEVVAAAGHVESKPVTIKATCATEGSSTVKCVVCKEIISSVSTPATNNHSFSDWKISVSATPETSGKQYRSCKCGKTEYRALSFVPAGSDCLVIASAGINAKVVVAGFTQEAVDSNDIICNFSRLGHDNPIVCGHNYRTLKNLHKTKIGDFIYLYIDGNYSKYIVTVSEIAVLINDDRDFRGASGLEFLADDLGPSLRLYTCHGDDRWIVVAKPVIN